MAQNGPFETAMVAKPFSKLQTPVAKDISMYVAKD
jgi:hypothetical protein